MIIIDLVKLKLYSFNFFPSRYERNIAKAEGDCDCLKNVQLVHVFKIILADVKHKLVPQ